jgi:hypothetical protein
MFWNNEKNTKLATVGAKTTAIAEAVIASPTDITIHRGPSSLSPRAPSNSLVQFRSKAIMIAGQEVKIDPYQLIRAIKRVTQQIGEYKDNDDIFSLVSANAFRKARGDLVNKLEVHFHIHWHIDKETGESVFYM